MENRKCFKSTYQTKSKKFSKKKKTLDLSIHFAITKVQGTYLVPFKAWENAS